MTTNDKRKWLERHGSLSVEDDGTHCWETQYGDLWYDGSDLITDMIAAPDINDEDEAIVFIYNEVRDVLWERIEDIRNGTS